MTSMSKFNKGLEEFKKEVKNELLECLQVATEKTFSHLVINSPTPKKSDDHFSKGCYVLSHRISTTGIDPGYTYWDGPKDFTALSTAFERVKSWPKEFIKNPFSIVTLSNVIPYAHDVEYGGVTWRRTGYYPYQHGYNFIRGSLQSIIDFISSKRRIK